MLTSRSPAIAAAGLFTLLFHSALLSAAEPLISVTATRLPQTVDDSLSSVTVISRDDIETKRPSDIVELLKTQASIDITQNGGPGGNVSIFMRGGESNHTLVLIDGVRVSSATTGGFAWQHLPLEQIESIEIVRGARTAQYGSDAISGVIQIFTRKPKTTSISAGAGSYGYRAVNTATGGSDDDFDYAISAGYAANDGFSASNSSAFGFNPDNDGYSNANLNLHLAKQLASIDHKLGFSLFRSEGDVDFDQGNSKTLNQAVNLTLEGGLDEAWDHKLILGWSDDQVESRDAGFSPDSEVETDRFIADWQNNIYLSEASTLTFGFNHVVDKAKNINLDSAAVVFNEKVTNNGLYLQLHTQQLAFDALLALRYDDYDTFGEKTTGQVAVGYQATDKARLVLSYGTAFKAPTLNDLFGFGGNPALEPETSSTLELGLQYRPADTHSVTVSIYETKTEDLISLVEVIPWVLYEAYNIDKASIQGVELIYSGLQGAWRWSASASYTDAEDKATGEPLLRRPRKKLAFDISYHAGHHHVGAGVFTSDKRLDWVGSNKGYLAAYTTVNLFGQYQLNKQLSLSGRVENLFDEKYEVLSGYNVPERSAYLTLRYDLE